MNTLQIALLFTGWLVYWLVKAGGEYAKKPQWATVPAFLKHQIFQIAISLVANGALLLFVELDPQSVAEYVDVSKPISLFVIGGAFGSQLVNLMLLLQKKDGK